jgi:hypothetical protein
MKKSFCKRAVSILSAVTITVLSIFPSSAAVSLSAGTPYFITSGSNGKNVNVYCNKTQDIKNKTKINLYNFSGDDTQKFTFSPQGGAYLIQPYNNSGYTVNVSALKAGSSVFTWKQNSKNDEYWLLEEAGGGVALKLKNAPDLCLTAEGDSLTLRKYSGSGSQIFQIDAVDGADSAESNGLGVGVAALQALEAGRQALDASRSEVHLDVPRVNTTDPQWKDKSFDKNDPNALIGVYGCTLCCITAVMSYRDGTLYRPDELCTRMNFKSGYLQWNGEIDGQFQTKVSYSLNTIKEQLDQQNPVLVKGAEGTNTHFVVVTGYTNSGASASDFTIMDPSYPKKTTLNQHLASFPDKLALYYLR